MKLKSLILENFRTYKERKRIDFNEGVTAFIGKNDVGKSTILEALEIFFNNNLIKIATDDPNVYVDNKIVTIGCVFTELPKEIVLDATAVTSLDEEYLLNGDGDLEIIKEFNCSLKTPKEAVFAIALHPTAEKVNDLLSLKQKELKDRLKTLGINDKQIDLRSNPSIRKAIWRNTPNLQLSTNKIPLDKEDAKKIWESLKKHLPSFALFQADRPSTDQDAEVQDPMKVAVLEAIRLVETELQKIEATVREKATEVALRTIDKLKEMDLSLASELNPEFKTEPKWDSLFKLTLTGDSGISINKRGSGVRRLILLNFFRAEAERKQKEQGSPGIIYAIEEPETSQHPTNQKLLVDALMDLSEQGNCQIILTTHVPGLAGLLSTESLRYVERDEYGNNNVRSGDENVYKVIANDLGILPDKRIKVLIFVEGSNDVTFLKHISAMLHEHDPSLPNLATDSRVAIIPLGGSTLIQWVDKHYLKGLDLPEIHIYDRDTQNPPKYQDVVNRVNARGDRSWATLTDKRELENYLHPDAIYEVLGVRITYGNRDDVPQLVAQAINNDSNNKYSPINEKRVKKLLNDDVAQRMTYERLQDIDPNGEVISWLKQIASRL